MADTHLVDWLEVKGFDVDFFTDEDLHFEGAPVLAPYKVVVTATHPEYYSLEMLNGLQQLPERRRAAHVPRRQRLLLGDARWIRPAGTSKCAGATAPSTGRALRASTITASPASPAGCGGSAAWRRSSSSASASRRRASIETSRTAACRAASIRAPQWIFEGIGRDELIGEHPSLVLEVGAAGSELDRADFALGTPPHTLVLASSSGHSDAYQHVVEQINTSNGARSRGHAEPAGAGRHGVPRVSERRRRVLVERDRVVRQPLVQQLHEQRLADHRERAAPVRRPTRRSRRRRRRRALERRGREG